MQIYNIHSLDQNSRFIRAILAGIPASIILGILYGYFITLVHFRMQILYIAIGYCLAMLVQKVGRGVTKRFAILAAVLTFLAIFIGDCISIFGGYGFLMHFTSIPLFINSLQIWLYSNFSTSINSLLGLLLKISGIYIAYRYGSIF